MSALEPTPLKSRWYFSVAAALFVFVVVGVYSTRMANDTTGYDDQQAVLRQAKLGKLQDADRKTLTTADWIDPTKGTVRIPIDEAMPEEVALLKTKPVAIGSAMEGAAPAPSTTTNAPAAPNAAPGTPPASTNAAPAAPSAAAANPKPAK